MKKKITAVSLLVILIALLALGSTAYFTAEGRATNVVTTNAIEMSISEEGDFIPTSTNGVYELPGTLMPSQTAGKVVTIHNDGPEPFYARVKVDIDIRDGGGQAMDDRFDQYVGLNFQSGWVLSNGWYYYNSSTGVAPNGDTSPIFTTVLLKPETPNEMMDAKVSIVVTAQAVQTKNNPIPAGGITQVPGWPEN